MLEFFKAPFLALHFSCYTLMTFLMMLSVILLSMLTTLLSILSVIRHLICGNKQAWHERKRQACGHHLPPSIQGKWLTIDDQKNKILASLCLASYLTTNWLQKIETKHCLLCRSYFCSYVCVVFQFDLPITKRNYLFVAKTSVFVPHT